MKNYTAIGGLCLSNWGGLAVLWIDPYGEKITTGFDFGNGLSGKRTTKIFVDSNDQFYFVRYGQKYYLDEIERY